jgi:hypothetical protein
MTPQQRLLLALRMSEQAIALTAAGIRQRHPKHSPEQVRHALLEAMLGRNVGSRVRRLR